MLENFNPREQTGRDSFARYRAQVRSAAMAALSILDNGPVEMVYCDVHDDFVVLKSENGTQKFVFYQVKTNGKANHNWTAFEVCGVNLKKNDSNQSAKIIENSFLGKMLINAANFKDSCERIVFQTNIYVDDTLKKFLEDLYEEDYSGRLPTILVENLNKLFGISNEEESRARTREGIKKLFIEEDVQYIKIKADGFEPLAREKIYEFSEIDLARTEAKEILLKLVSLVEEKSSGVISDWTQENIDKMSGISISDMLSILSISEDAYKYLASGGDRNALKNSSIMQRALKEAGAGEDEILFCSRCKIKWDDWLRNSRLVISEFNIHAIKGHVRDTFVSNMIGSGFNVSGLRVPVESLISTLSSKGLLFDLSEEEILGALFSELVRSRS